MNTGIGRVCCGRRFLNPLGEGIAGTPQVLAIEDEGLSVEMIGSALRFDDGSAGTRVCQKLILPGSPDRTSRSADSAEPGPM